MIKDYAQAYELASQVDQPSGIWNNIKQKSFLLSEIISTSCKRQLKLFNPVRPIDQTWSSISTILRQ